jgi:hypothetical protein
MPSGLSLMLIREPDNDFDTNAIAVWVLGKTLRAMSNANQVTLRTMLDGYGFQLDEVLNNDWQLGYVAAKTGEAWAIAPAIDGGMAVVATLTTAITGAPAVKLEWF